MPAVKITQKPIGIPGDDTHFIVTQPELPEGYTPTGQETEEELAELKVESVREIEMDDMVELIQDKFDMDVTPTTGSSKPVTSGGIKAALDLMDDDISSLNEDITNIGDAIGAINSITKKTQNMFDDKVLLDAGLSVGEDGYYYGTVSAWHAAFSELFPVADAFEDDKRYTISFDYYFSGVDTFTGNAVAVKAVYKDDVTANVLSVQANVTTPASVSATTVSNKSVDHLTMNTLDYRGNNYVFHVGHIQVEEGVSKTDYLPHIVVYDASMKLAIQNVKDELAQLDTHIEKIIQNETTFDWESGGVSSVGSFVSANVCIRTNAATKLIAGTQLSCDSGYKFRLYRYSGYVDPSMNSEDVKSKYLDTSGWQTNPYTVESSDYYVLSFATTSDTASVGIESHLAVRENAAVNEIYNILPQYAKASDVAGFASEEKITSAVEDLSENTVALEWEKGTYNSSTGAKQSVNTVARSTKLIHLVEGVVCFVDTGYMYRLYRYTENDLTTFDRYYDYSYDSSKHWITGYFEVPIAGYYGVVVTDYALSTISDVAAVGGHIHINPHLALNHLKNDLSLGIMPYNLEGLKTYIDTVAAMGGDVVLSFVTDIHGGYPDTYAVINYLANSGIGNYMFEMGDVIQSTFPTRAEAVAYLRESFHTMAYTRTNTPIIMLQGNHDTNPLSGTDTTKNVTQEIFYALSMARTKDTHQPPKKAYGYVDIDEAKVRVIFLNTSDIYSPSTGNALVTGQYTMIQQAQLTWFTNVALNFSDKDAPTDWSVIIVSHDSLSQVAGSAFGAILTAFMAGTSAQGTQTVSVGSHSNVLSYDCDFTSQGGIDVICEVNGHHHKDMIRELGTTGIKQVYVACEGPASASYDGDGGATVYYDRVRGTTDEHLIDTLVLDKSSRTVYFKRFGVGEDRSITY